MKKKYMFKKRRGWFGRILVRLGLAPNHQHFPMFGIEAVGKSYFIFSLAYFISSRKLGKVVGEEADFIMQFVPVMLRREKLDATPGYRDIDLQVNKIYFEDYQGVLDEIARHRIGMGTPNTDHQEEADFDSQDTVPCDLFLSTNDLSGAAFRQAMEQLGEPHANMRNDELAAKFLDLIEACEGAIVVIDIVGNLDQATFEARQTTQIREQLSNQLLPLFRAIELVLQEGNFENRVFPIFLVFTKRDIHGLSPAELQAMVDEVFAIMLARLDRKVVVRVHSIQNMGFGEDPEALLKTDSDGIGRFIADLYGWSQEM